MIHWLRNIQGRAATVAMVCLVACFARAGEVDQTGLAWDFWKPRSELTAGELRGTPAYCRGTYRWPVFPHPANIPADEFPVEAEARSLEYWDSGPVILQGDVVIKQGNRTLKAPAVNLNHETRMGSVTEQVQIEEPDAILRGAEAEMNLDTKATTITGAEFLLLEGDFRGTARQLERDDDGNMLVSSGSFTRCEPGNNNWRISSRRFYVKDGSAFGTARDAVVRVKNVPVLYTPYITFPINDKRKSGWLFPNIGYSSQSGLEFAPPYYLNLAPNYDATVMPRYFQKRGLGIEAEFRHLSSWQQTTLVGSFLGNDKEYDGVYERDDFQRLEEAGLVEGPFVPADRWLYAMYHKGDFSNWRTTVDYTAVSDRDYFRNLGTDLNVAARRELERRGEIQYLAGGLDVRLWAQRFDRLDEVTVDPYQRLPELALNYAGALPGPFEWSIGASGVSFDRNNDDLTGTNRIVGNRMHVEPRVSLPLARSWGFLTMTGG
ncbi:MAG: LPS assembly protein LptD, partial [Gammaproteobacteria bacterium]